MDHCGCRYGLASTYQETVFLRRVGDYVFELSPVVLHTTISATQPLAVSLKEDMLFFAYLADGNDYHGPHW